MSIDPAVGTIRWTPGDDQVGPHSVVVQALDGRGGFIEQVFDVGIGVGVGVGVVDLSPAIISTRFTETWAVRNQHHRR